MSSMPSGDVLGRASVQVDGSLSQLRSGAESLSSASQGRGSSSVLNNIEPVRYTLGQKISQMFSMIVRGAWSFLKFCKVLISDKAGRVGENVNGVDREKQQGAWAPEKVERFCNDASILLSAQFDRLECKRKPGSTADQMAEKRELAWGAFNHFISDDNNIILLNELVRHCSNDVQRHEFLKTFSGLGEQGEKSIRNLMDSLLNASNFKRIQAFVKVTPIDKQISLIRGNPYAANKIFKWGLNWSVREFPVLSEISENLLGGAKVDHLQPHFGSGRSKSAETKRFLLEVGPSIAEHIATISTSTEPKVANNAIDKIFDQFISVSDDSSDNLKVFNYILAVVQNAKAQGESGDVLFNEMLADFPASSRETLKNLLIDLLDNPVLKMVNLGISRMTVEDQKRFMHNPATGHDAGALRTAFARMVISQTIGKNAGEGSARRSSSIDSPFMLAAVQLGKLLLPLAANKPGGYIQEIKRTLKDNRDLLDMLLKSDSRGGLAQHVEQGLAQLGMSRSVQQGVVSTMSQHLLPEFAGLLQHLLPAMSEKNLGRYIDTLSDDLIKDLVNWLGTVLFNEGVGNDNRDIISEFVALSLMPEHVDAEVGVNDVELELEERVIADGSENRNNSEGVQPFLLKSVKDWMTHAEKSDKVDAAQLALNILGQKASNTKSTLSAVEHDTLNINGLVSLSKSMMTKLSTSAILRDEDNGAEDKEAQLASAVKEVLKDNIGVVAELVMTSDIEGQLEKSVSDLPVSDSVKRYLVNVLKQWPVGMLMQPMQKLLPYVEPDQLKAIIDLLPDHAFTPFKPLIDKESLKAVIPDLIKETVGLDASHTERSAIQSKAIEQLNGMVDNLMPEQRAGVLSVMLEALHQGVVRSNQAPAGERVDQAQPNDSELRRNFMAFSRKMIDISVGERSDEGSRAVNFKALIKQNLKYLRPIVGAEDMNAKIETLLDSAGLPTAMQGQIKGHVDAFHLNDLMGPIKPMLPYMSDELVGQIIDALPNTMFAEAMIRSSSEFTGDGVIQADSILGSVKSYMSDRVDRSLKALFDTLLGSGSPAIKRDLRALFGMPGTDIESRILRADLPGKSKKRMLEECRQLQREASVEGSDLNQFKQLIEKSAKPEELSELLIRLKPSSKHLQLVKTLSLVIGPLASKDRKFNVTTMKFFGTQAVLDSVNKAMSGELGLRQRQQMIDHIMTQMEKPSADATRSVAAGSEIASASAEPVRDEDIKKLWTFTADLVNASDRTIDFYHNGKMVGTLLEDGGYITADGSHVVSGGKAWIQKEIERVQADYPAGSPESVRALNGALFNPGDAVPIRPDGKPDGVVIDHNTNIDEVLTARNEQSRGELKSVLRNNFTFIANILAKDDFKKQFDNILVQSDIPDDARQMMMELMDNMLLSFSEEEAFQGPILKSLVHFDDQLVEQLINCLPNDLMDFFSERLTNLLNDLIPQNQLQFFKKFSTDLVGSLGERKIVQDISRELTSNYYQAIPIHDKRSFAVAVLKVGKPKKDADGALTQEAITEVIGAISQAGGPGFQKGMQLFSGDVIDPATRTSLEQMKSDVTPMSEVMSSYVIHAEMEAINQKRMADAREGEWKMLQLTPPAALRTHFLDSVNRGPEAFKSFVRSLPKSVVSSFLKSDSLNSAHVCQALGVERDELDTIDPKALKKTLCNMEDASLSRLLLSANDADLEKLFNYRLGSATIGQAHHLWIREVEVSGRDAEPIAGAQPVIGGRKVCKIMRPHVDQRANRELNALCSIDGLPSNIRETLTTLKESIIEETDFVNEHEYNRIVKPMFSENRNFFGRDLTLNTAACTESTSRILIQDLVGSRPIDDDYYGEPKKEIQRLEAAIAENPNDVEANKERLRTLLEAYSWEVGIAGEQLDMTLGRWAEGVVLGDVSGKALKCPSWYGDVQIVPPDCAMPEHADQKDGQMSSQIGSARADLDIEGTQQQAPTRLKEVHIQQKTVKGKEAYSIRIFDHDGRITDFVRYKDQAPDGFNADFDNDLTIDAKRVTDWLKHNPFEGGGLIEGDRHSGNALQDGNTLNIIDTGAVTLLRRMQRVGLIKVAVGVIAGSKEYIEDGLTALDMSLSGLEPKQREALLSSLQRLVVDISEEERLEDLIGILKKVGGVPLADEEQTLDFVELDDIRKLKDSDKAYANKVVIASQDAGEERIYYIKAYDHTGKKVADEKMLESDFPIGAQKVLDYQIEEGTLNEENCRKLLDFITDKLNCKQPNLLDRLKGLHPDVRKKLVKFDNPADVLFCMNSVLLEFGYKALDAHKIDYEDAAVKAAPKNLNGESEKTAQNVAFLQLLGRLDYSRATKVDFSSLFTGQFGHWLADGNNSIHLIKTINKLANVLAKNGVPAPKGIIQLARGSKFCEDQVRKNNGEKRFLAVKIEECFAGNPTEKRKMLKRLQEKNIGDIYFRALLLNDSGLPSPAKATRLVGDLLSIGAEDLYNLNFKKLALSGAGLVSSGLKGAVNMIRGTFTTSKKRLVEEAIEAVTNSPAEQPVPRASLFQNMMTR